MRASLIVTEMINTISTKNSRTKSKRLKMALSNFFYQQPTKQFDTIDYSPGMVTTCKLYDDVKDTKYSYCIVFSILYQMLRTKYQDSIEKPQNKYSMP
jgi:hypothetical protein